MNRAKIPPRGARRGGYESNCGGPASGGGRRKKMDSGRVSGFFETRKPLPTKYSSVKVIHSKKKIIGDLTKMSSILTALNGRFNGSDQSDRQCQT